MKTKTSLLVTALLAASHVLCFAQASNPVADPVESTKVINNGSEPVAGSAEPKTETKSPEPVVAAAEPSAAATAPSAATTAPIVAAAEPAKEASSSESTSPADSTSASTNEEVPLITIDDASLPDAIRTLARQAGINFQFDPDVINPAPDANGKIPEPPKVSFRWENVTANDALMAILENYKLQMIRDPKTKIARVAKKDAAALDPLVTKVFQLQYSSPTNLVTIITNTISARSRVVADIRTSQLVIAATEKDLDSVETLIAKLDTQTRQILIEARFLEINKNPHTAKGIDWTDTLAAQRVTFGNVSKFQEGLEPRAPTGTNNDGFAGIGSGILPSGILPGDPSVIADTASGFGPMGFLNAQGASVVLSFLNSDSDAESIATPRAVTLENVPTELSVVRNIPVFEEQQGNNTGGTVSANTVKPNYLLAGPGGTILNEVGIKLFVTPRVYGNSNVFLDLKPEISDRELKPESAVLSDHVSTAPIFSRRKLQTQTMIPSGYTLVLGGLRQDNSSKAFTKVPVFGDLPGIGLLFRKDEKSRDKKDLVIFVTPTILRTGDFQKNQNPGEFLHQKMDPDKPDEDWSAWDSGKPANWKCKDCPDDEHSKW